MIINSRLRLSNYKNISISIPNKMNKLPTQYVSRARETSQELQQDEQAKVPPKPLTSLQYAILEKFSLFIAPFACPTAFLTHYSMSPYKAKAAVLTLRHFLPKTSNYQFDSNLMVFKWFVSANEMSPFEDQANYLAKIKASTNIKDYAYLLMCFDMAFILKREVETPMIKFVQPQATRALTNEDIEREMAAKFSSNGIDFNVLTNTYQAAALENGEEEEEETATPQGKKKNVPGVKKSIVKEKTEVVSTKKVAGKKMLVVKDDEEELLQ